VISHAVLIVAEPFVGLSGERVAQAIASELSAGERELTVDLLVVEERPDDAREWWRVNVPAERLRAARAVVIATARLDERTLARSVAFEIATSARQAGVPAYAITVENALDPFDARMLDLQAILEAGSPRSLRSAGAQLALLV
jgi:hypothetical protein